MPQKVAKAAKSQSQPDKFKAMAKELETDETEAGLDRALKKVAASSAIRKAKDR